MWPMAHEKKNSFYSWTLETKRQYFFLVVAKMNKIWWKTHDSWILMFAVRSWDEIAFEIRFSQKTQRKIVFVKSSFFSLKMKLEIRNKRQLIGKMYYKWSVIKSPFPLKEISNFSSRKYISRNELQMFKWRFLPLVHCKRPNEMHENKNVLFYSVRSSCFNKR